MVTKEQIIKILSEYPNGLMAKEIARKLRTDKHTINGILYRNQTIFSVKDFVWRSLDETTGDVDDEDDEIDDDNEEEGFANQIPIFKVSQNKGSKFHYYNCNPHNVRTDDCVIRAIAAGCGDSWEDTVRNLSKYMIKYGYHLSTPELYGIYLKDKGWVKQKQPSKKDGKKYTLHEFLEHFEYKGHAVVHAGNGHVSYLADGYVWDIWNCEDSILGSYWVPKEEVK